MGNVTACKEAAQKPYSKEFRGEVLAACDQVRGMREGVTYFKGTRHGLDALSKSGANSTRLGLV